MITTVRLGHKSLSANLSEPIDLTIPLKNGPENPNCFWAPMPEFSPVRAGNFVGSTAEGGSVNFFIFNSTGRQVYFLLMYYLLINPQS